MEMIYQSRAWILAITILTVASYQAQAQPNTQAQLVLTLDKAWQQAETYNKEVQLQRQQVVISQELVKDRQTERLPRVVTRGEYTYLGALYGYEPKKWLKNPESVAVPPSPHVYSAALSTEWDLYTGGRIKNQIETQAVNAELEGQRLNLTRADIRVRVAQVYLDLKRNTVYRGLTESNIKESERRLRQIQSLYKNGVVLRSDVLRAELQTSRQQLLLTEINNNIILANQRLNILMGVPEDQLNVPAEEILPATAMLTGSYEDYLRQAQGQAPELRVAGLQTRLSQLRLESTEVIRRPQVGMFAGYSYNFPNRLTFPFVPQVYSFGEVGVRVSYNITGRYYDRHAERAAELGLERQKLAEEHVLDQKREEVKTAYVHFQETLERIRVAEQNIQQASENYRIVNSTYFNQLALLTDLLDADNQLLQSRFDLVSAQAQAATQYYQLQKALGTL
ncbi:TolC family protein [Hymenobacter cavernae]|uniref:Transporter n=1 Tax=Hymenobacter cavernae TaxID=2044852 RepID=A0ABQ1TSX9_9BACT|nr:TolC family protein [Hymenobacter cavernae]GGF02626.1 transporter [Hymenobacter cavernae]